MDSINLATFQGDVFDLITQDLITQNKIVTITASEIHCSICPVFYPWGKSIKVWNVSIEIILDPPIFHTKRVTQQELESFFCWILRDPDFREFGVIDFRPLLIYYRPLLSDSEHKFPN